MKLIKLKKLSSKASLSRLSRHFFVPCLYRVGRGLKGISVDLEGLRELNGHRRIEGDIVRFNVIKVD